MKNEKTKSKKTRDREILTAWMLATSQKTITRTQLLKLCEDNGVEGGMPWLTNDTARRVGRGVYSIDLLDLVQSVKSKPTPKVKATKQQKWCGAAQVAALSAATATVTDIKTRVMETLSTKLDSESNVPVVYENYVPFGNFPTIVTIVKSFKFFPVFITGPSGNGKTMAVEQACAKTGRECITISMTDETDEGDLIGNYVLIDGNMVWRDGPVTTAARKGAILLIDELDYGSKNLACLQRVLEGKPFLLKKKNEVVVPAAGFNIIATANTKGQGSDSGRYMYTNILNEAFLERFPITLEQSWAPKKIEIQILAGELLDDGMADTEFAKELVEWADIIRKTYEDGGVEDVISTRRLVHIVKCYAIFEDKLKAIDACLSRFGEETKASFLELYSKINDPAPVVAPTFEEELPAKGYA